MRPHQYVGRQGPNLPTNVQREAMVEPRKIQRETKVEVIEIDPESDESDSDGYIGKKKVALVAY